MKFDRSNKFEKCYYGQASKYSSKHQVKTLSSKEFLKLSISLSQLVRKQKLINNMIKKRPDLASKWKKIEVSCSI